MVQLLKEHGISSKLPTEGPADGVGGAIKRKLDQHVAHGHDITNAEEAYSYLLHNVKVDIYYVSETDIEQMNQIISNDVIPIEVVMTSKNLPLLPLQPESINNDFDIYTGHILHEKSEILTTQKRQKLTKKPIDVDKESEKVKRVRRSTRSLSGLSTSVESKFSIYSDSDLFDVVNGDLNSDQDDNLQVNFGVTEPEKNIEKENVTEAFEIEDKDAIIESRELVNIDKREENTIGEGLQDQTENNLDVETGEPVKDKVDEELFIGEAVLVPHYEKKCWKYYIRVIKHIDFVYDWKAAAGNIIKTPGQRHFKFKESKRFWNTRREILQSKVRQLANICRKDKNFNMIVPQTINSVRLP
ncbi:unnamed protein product [Euphydryas editha]|uniref:Uncharacterized protein n=1 Tax=Euphydryas editha TaxID=104508 RepID=A0AAU9U2P4_EUPED|nr:unnamed protein product [Euphydryas editha]